MTFNGQKLQSFYKAGGGNFTLGGANYTGTQKTGRGTINYDGHAGYDFGVSIGTRVNAAAEGDVVTVGEDSASGKYVIVQHAGGYQTTYLHLSKTVVANGTHVFSGTKVGESGDTGAAAGAPHLHFEVKKSVNGTVYSVDPYGWQGSGTDPYTAMTEDRVVNERLWGSGGTTTPVPVDQRPTSPRNLTWSRVYAAPRAIYLSWGDATGENRYDLQYLSANGWQTYGSTAANSTGSYTYFGQSGTYYLRVLAVNAYGSTSSGYITVSI